MALSEDGIVAINHELNGTNWPPKARQAVIDLFERIAAEEAEVERLRACLTYMYDYAQQIAATAPRPYQNAAALWAAFDAASTYINLN